MSAPNPLDLGTIEKAIGVGAFVIGGAGTNFGQDITETFVKGLYELEIDALNLLGSLEQALMRLPLEALQLFQHLFPTSLPEAWSDVTTAVNAIMSQVIPRPIMQSVQDFENWVAGDFDTLQTIINQIIAIVQGLTVDPATTGVQAFQTWFSSLGSWQTTLQSDFDSLTTNFGSLSTSVNTVSTEVQQIMDIVRGLAVTALNASVQGFKDWYSVVSTFQTDFNTLKNLLYGGPTVASQILGSAVPGTFGSPDIVAAVEALAAGAVAGITGIGSEVAGGLAALNNQLRGLTGLVGYAPGAQSPAGSISSITQTNNENIANRAQYKPSFMAIDPTADPVFNLPLGGSTPSTVSLTASATLMGVIGTPDAGIKESVAFIGQNTTNITSMLIRLYSIDTATGALTKVHASPDLMTLTGGVSNLLAWNYYDFPSGVIQQFTLGPATAGTFLITFNGKTTTAIAYNATAATIQTALAALPNIGAGNVRVTGGGDSPFTISLEGTLAGTTHPLITIDGSGLTGGDPLVNDFLKVEQGHWYAVEMRVTGTGTYLLVGIENGWMPAHPTKFPKKLGITRDPSTSPDTIASPTYSDHVPWFALCGSAGESQHPPELWEQTTPGAFTYNIPFFANRFDIIIIGGAGGGSAGAWPNYAGGGGPGSWNQVTLTRDQMTNNGAASTVTGTVGGGGGAGVSVGARGGSGGGTSITLPGYGSGSLSAGAGGGGAGAQSGANPAGFGPGNDTFNGNTYFGGATQNSLGGGGNSPGGGGAGGTPGGGFGQGTPGGAGAPGAVFILAYKV